MTQKDTEIHLMTPNVDRIQAAILYAIMLADRRGKSLTQYDLVKTLFLADRAHLNEWGRPVTYDNYSAMKHGPVPSLAYDLLKGNARAMRDLHILQVPWTARSAPERGAGVKTYSVASEPFDVEDILSESDMEALADALVTVVSLGFGQVRKLTHEDPAYIDAWQEGGDRRAYDMKLGLLFDSPNFERAELLEDQSQYV
jgi:uncharacterized phage-associated protein